MKIKKEIAIIKRAKKRRMLTKDEGTKKETKPEPSSKIDPLIKLKMDLQKIVKEDSLLSGQRIFVQIITNNRGYIYQQSINNVWAIFTVTSIRFNNRSLKSRLEKNESFEGLFETVY